MAGKKGQIRRRTTQGEGRQKVWQSMRIMKRFTLPDLVRTSGGKLDNIRKFVLGLTIHGYLSEVPGWQRGESGSFKSWSLRINPGPGRPLLCQHCGQPTTAKECRNPEDGND